MVTLIPHLSLVPYSRLRRVPGVVRVMLVAAIAMIVSSTASAALREYRVQFEPSASSSAVGYSLHIGSEAGTYSLEFDLGAPPVEGGTVIYAVDLEDSIDLFVALRAYDSNGIQSAFSNELQVAAVVPTPTDTSTSDGGTSTGGDSGTDSTDTNTTGDGTTGGSGGDFAGTGRLGSIDDGFRLGLTTTSAGIIKTVFGDGHLDFLTMDSLAAKGDLRPVRCDLDGDGDLDLVLGFGSGSGGQVAIILLENQAVVSVSTILAGPERYREASGRTNPACGDLDGDGRAEIVVGFGLKMLGVVQVFDDMATGFSPLASARSDADGYMQIPVPENFRGPMYPAIGNIDDDGMDELVVGMGRAKHGGRLVILDDLSTGFAIHPGNQTGQPWLRLDAEPNRIQRRTSTMPALGDIDGDGRDEIAVGFGTGSRGRIVILDDAVDGFPTTSEEAFRLTAGRPGYRKKNGHTRVAFGNVDGDAYEELIVGFRGRRSREVQVFDDAIAGMQPMTDDNGFISASDKSVKITPTPVN